MVAVPCLGREVRHGRDSAADLQPGGLQVPGRCRGSNGEEPVRAPAAACPPIPGQHCRSGTPGWLRLTGPAGSRGVPVPVPRVLRPAPAAALKPPIQHACPARRRACRADGAGKHIPRPPAGGSRDPPSLHRGAADICCTHSRPSSHRCWAASAAAGSIRKGWSMTCMLGRDPAWSQGSRADSPRETPANTPIAGARLGSQAGIDQQQARLCAAHYDKHRAGLCMCHCCGQGAWLRACHLLHAPCCRRTHFLMIRPIQDVCRRSPCPPAYL